MYKEDKKYFLFIFRKYNIKKMIKFFSLNLGNYIIFRLLIHMLTSIANCKKSLTKILI